LESDSQALGHLLHLLVSVPGLFHRLGGGGAQVVRERLAFLKRLDDILRCRSQSLSNERLLLHSCGMFERIFRGISMTSDGPFKRV
jgi:hypothetical protein